MTAKIVCQVTRDGNLAQVHRAGEVLSLAPWYYPSEPREALPWDWSTFYGRWCLAYAILICATRGKVTLSQRLAADLSCQVLAMQNPVRFELSVAELQDWVAQKCAESITGR